jgi:hypothetical protein
MRGRLKPEPVDLVLCGKANYKAVTSAAGSTSSLRRPRAAASTCSASPGRIAGRAISAIFMVNVAAPPSDLALVAAGGVARAQPAATRTKSAQQPASKRSRRKR